MSTILITDDNSQYRAGIIELLKLETPYTILEAADGQAALTLMRQHHPDLVLCDIDMPRMTGLGLLALVKTDPVLRDIPFIIVTGRVDVETVQAVKDLGAEAYIQKPMDVALLFTLIRVYLDD